MPQKKMIKALRNLRQEQMESVMVQSSSTKILTFLVNDMLDFAQLRSGKFRKDLFNFDVREAIAEIVSIQMQKAEFCGINLSFDVIGFPMKDGIDQIISSSRIDPNMFDYIICSDLQRV
jgi:signal transduction histidine kinase